MNNVENIWFLGTFVTDINNGNVEIFFTKIVLLTLKRS